MVDAEPVVRLTRRGWAVVIVAALLALASALWLAHAGAQSSAPHGSPPATVIVRYDDTLWSIATRIAPDRDPRVVIAELERRNDLTAPIVRVGQVLRTG